MCISKMSSFAVAVFLLTVNLGCGEDPAVGVLLPTSGAAGAYGLAVDDGIQLALAEAMDETILPPEFALMAADTKSRPKTAAAELRRMVYEDGIAIVIGGVTSDEAEAMIPVIEKNHVVLLSPTAPANDLTRKSRYFFRLFATDEVEGSTAARYLFNKAEARKVLVVTDDSAFTRGIETEFRQHFQLSLGGEIVATVHTERENWARKVSDMLAAHEPQAVYIVGHGEHTLKVLQHLHEGRYRGVRCTTSSIYLNHVISGGGEAMEGVVFPMVSSEVASQESPMGGFIDHFRGRYGNEPDIYAAHGYDAMRLAIHAVVNARTSRATALRRYMSTNIRAFEGVTGPVAFNARGDVPRYPVMHQIWHERVVSCSWLSKMREERMIEILENLGLRPTPTPVSTPHA